MAYPRNAVMSVRSQVPSNEFSGHTGNIWMAEWVFEGYASRPPVIIFTEDVPATSNFQAFNDGTLVPEGSTLVDLTTGDEWRMSESNTWDAVVT